MNKIYYKVATSDKTGNKYACVYVDMGWKKVYLTFDKYNLCDVLDLKPSELLEKECEKEIGYINTEEK